MSLTNVVRRLTAAERAAEPRSLGLIAYLDGFGQAVGWEPMTYPRPITTTEAQHWREGWREGREADAVWRAAQHHTDTQETTP